MKEQEIEKTGQVEGRNAVLEALRAGVSVDKVFLLEDCRDGAMQTIFKEAKKRNCVIQSISKEQLYRMSQTGRSQGVIAMTAASSYSTVGEMLECARQTGEDPFLIILDGITDPYNLGAIIRTASQAGAHGVILPKRHSAGLTATVARTSAGAVNHILIAKVANLTQTIAQLKQEGIWIACADMEGEELYRQNLAGPIGLVVGSEGAGVSRLVREACDFSVSIPMKGQVDSLNVSVATGILAYEIVRQRKEYGK